MHSYSNYNIQKMKQMKIEDNIITIYKDSPPEIVLRISEFMGYVITHKLETGLKF